MSTRTSRSLLLLLLIASMACEAPEHASTVARPAPIHAVGFENVTLDDGFWTPRLETNRTVTIPHIMRQNEETGRVDNLRKGAGLVEGPYEGRRFNDTDLYKVIEAASYALAQQDDPELEAQVDDLIEIIAAAQTDDGYLFPAHTVDPDNPAPGVGTERWMYVERGSHELYNAGHLIEAAVAHFRATGKRTLLDVAIRFADLIDRDFGPDARHDIPGHEEIELALVKLADVTGEERYTELARFFIDQRGGEQAGEPYPEESDFAIYNDRAYKQDHAPVVEQRKASGHAVRASYLYTGMADVAARTDAPGYREALEAIWEDTVGNKLYLHGGIGARGTFESFGEDYELPNRAYAETCAAIGNDLWNHRMFLDTGDPRYLDVMERVLYNGFLSGVSVDGDEFFYTNVLVSDGDVERSTYFDVACCPANLARTMALLPGFVYAHDERTIFVNLYVGSEATVQLPGGSVTIRQETDYPWDGTVRVTVTPETPMEFELALRVPGWANGAPVPSDLYTFADGVEPERPRLTFGPVDTALPAASGADWYRLGRTWEPGDTLELDIPMPVRRVAAHAEVEENLGRVALQRGPLVYALEAIDNDGSVEDLALPADAELAVRFDPELLGGVAVIEGSGLRVGAGEAPSVAHLSAIPYFAWANRGAAAMAVWVPAVER